MRAAIPDVCTEMGGGRVSHKSISSLAHQPWDSQGKWAALGLSPAWVT